MSTKTKSSFTPGPWTVFRQSSCDRGESYGVKAPAPHHWVIPTLNINPADAHLIACAPELLDCLRAVEVLFGHLAKDSTQKTWLDNASAVIAKATEVKP